MKIILTHNPSMTAWTATLADNTVAPAAGRVVPLVGWGTSKDAAAGNLLLQLRDHLGFTIDIKPAP